MKKLNHSFQKIKNEWCRLLQYAKKHKFGIMFYTALGVLSSVLSLFVVVFSKNLIDAVVEHQNREVLKNALLATAFALSSFIISSISSWVVAQISTKISTEMRHELYSHIMLSKWSSIGKFHTGELINRLEGDISAVSNGVVSFIPSIFTKSMIFFGSFAIILYYDKTMAILALLSAPILLISSKYLLRTMRKYSKLGREHNGKILSFAEESLQNIIFIKGFDLTKDYIGNFKSLLLQSRHVSLRYERFSILLNLTLSVIGLAVSYACYGWGVYRLWQGVVTFGTMTLFIQLAGGLSSSFSSLTSLVPQAVRISTSSERLNELSEADIEQDFDKEKVLRMKEFLPCDISLKLSDVEFSYEDAIPVLRDLNLDIKNGEVLGIVGASGEGKTTLLRLLLGLISPTKGKLTITINGETVDISDSTRRLVAYVPQEINLFSGSIRSNLLLIKPDATDDELIETLKISSAWDFISNLPDGLDTIITPQMKNLSLGQQQRIAIARALLADCPILVMDEVTSALDYKMEEKVLEQLMSASKDKICIVTTHRDSVLKYCDKVYECLPYV